MSKLVWDAEHGWHDGPEVTVTLDDHGRLSTSIGQTEDETPEEYADLSVCVDCLMMQANGTLGQGDDAADHAHAELMAAQWPDHDLANNCPEGCEGSFSWQSCDGCGSTLGGDRHPMAAFPHTRNSQPEA